MRPGRTAVEARPSATLLERSGVADAHRAGFDRALAGQRRLVDQTLSTQRNLVGQLCDTAGGLAAAGARLGRGADGEPTRT